MSRIQVKVALDKEANPDLYCPTRKCLWKTFDGSKCPRHNGSFHSLEPSRDIHWLEKDGNTLTINDRL